ncbi:MAG: N-acetylmuramoyl-L-alanine amidase [Muribaculaceae bacterium]|nr:N-acetylmuramoyl-L-alanine amidase [Muribaculaceae bacterium]
MRNINKIIIHCSATPEGKNFTVKQIDACHRQRGFNGIGYHFVIYLDGSIHVGRALAKAGAHCKGHNAHSIGVCYIGGVAADGKTPKDTRTDAQKASLVKLITELRQQFPNASVHGHREFANKACPCFDARKEYKDL